MANTVTGEEEIVGAAETGGAGVGIGFVISGGRDVGRESFISLETDVRSDVTGSMG